MADDWKREALFNFFSKRTQNKRAENYVVNYIWARLHNLNLEPVTQQYILLKKKKYALIDLYFPQLHYAIECDEGHHERNKKADAEREKNIYNVLSSIREEDFSDLEIKHIKVTKNIENIHDDMDKIVEEIKVKIKEKIKTPSGKLVWKSPSERAEDAKKEGKLTVNMLLPFRKIADVLNFFCCKTSDGKEYTNYQQALRHIDDEYAIWCPKLAVETSEGKVSGSKDWKNTLNEDWTQLKSEDNRGIKDAYDSKKVANKMITFAQGKDSYGANLAYRFIGVYELETKEDNTYIYNRIASEVDLNEIRSRLNKK